MELQVTQERENQLLSRKEVIVQIKVEGTTPSREEIHNALQKYFTAAADEIIIDKVKHPFGTKSAKVFAKIYSNKEMAKREPAYKIKRGMKETKAEDKKEEEKQEAREGGLEKGEKTAEKKEAKTDEKKE